jgi:hypothetical protein
VNKYLLTLFYCLGLGNLVGCTSHLTLLNKTYQAGITYQQHKAFKELREQLKETHSYRGYKLNRLRFVPYYVKAGYGLYYLEIPGKNTKDNAYNADIPCIISPRYRLLNSVYFEGELVGDSIKLRELLKGILYDLRADESDFDLYFSLAELDSLQKIFLYGGMASIKPGRHVEFR